MDSHELAARLAALAHPARIEILRHLAAHRSCCCGQVVERLDLAQSTVSQHLKTLVAAGLVRFEADGQRSRYAVNKEALAAISGALAAFTRSCC
jgi:DNA-binding transcriptional ArsR family regulator